MLHLSWLVYLNVLLSDLIFSGGLIPQVPLALKALQTHIPAIAARVSERLLDEISTVLTNKPFQSNEGHTHRMVRDCLRLTSHYSYSPTETIDDRKEIAGEADVR